MRTAASTTWFLWLGVIAPLTAGPFLWHVEYFRDPGPRFYTAVRIALPLLAAFLAAYVFFRRKGMVRYELPLLSGLLAGGLLLQEFRATLVALLIFLACYGFGRRTLIRLKLPVASPADGIALAAGFGLASLIPILFLFGLLGWFYAAPLLALLIASCLVFRRHAAHLWIEINALFAGWARRRETDTALAAVVVVFAAIFSICTAMVVLSPSRAFDVLKMHLPSALYYASEHALRPVPLLDYSYFPQGGEVLMTLGYLLGGQPAAQMVPFLSFPLTLLLAFAIARECGAGPLGSAAGIVLGGSMPFLHWSGSVSKNDLALALFELAALHSYLVWRRERDFRRIQLGACFFAASFGIKHVALFGAIPLGLLFLHAVWRARRRLRAALSLAVIFLCFGLFWHIRTYLLTGNPVYPQNLRTTANASYGKKPTWKESAIGYARVPWEIHFEGRKWFETPLDNPMGIVLLVFAPLWLLVRGGGRPPAQRVCFFYIALYLVYWASIWPVIRYALAPFLLLAVLTVARVETFYQSSGPLRRASLAVVSAYCLAFAMLGTMIIELHGPQLSYFTGRLDRNGYLREAILTFRSLEFLKRTAKAEELVLSFGNCSDAYAPVPWQFDSNCEEIDSYSADWIRQKLRSRDYGLLLVPDDEAGHRIVEQVGQLRRTNRLYQDGSFAIYRLEALPAKIGSGDA